MTWIRVTVSGREGSFPASLQNPMSTCCLLHLHSHTPTHYLLLNVGLVPLKRYWNRWVQALPRRRAGEVGQNFCENTA